MDNFLFIDKFRLNQAIFYDKNVVHIVDYFRKVIHNRENKPLNLCQLYSFSTIFQGDTI